MILIVITSFRYFRGWMVLLHLRQNLLGLQPHSRDTGHQHRRHQQDADNQLKHEEGVLSMARAMMPDSAGSQFFIMHKPAPHLDGEYAAFGKIIEGMDVVDRIACEKTFGDSPYHKQVMKTVTVDTFGEEYPEPEKLDR